LGQLGREGAREAPGPVAAASCACGASGGSASGGGGGGRLLLACGAESTAVVLPCGVCGFSWGWNEHGNLGTGGAGDAAAPCRLPLPPAGAGGVTALAAAGATLFLNVERF